MTNLFLPVTASLPSVTFDDAMQPSYLTYVYTRGADFRLQNFWPTKSSTKVLFFNDKKIKKC